MSEENKNIDQLFSDAAQNQKAPQYNPAYWEEMNAFLNARAAKRRTLILWTSFGVVLCLFLLSTLFVINAEQDTARVKYAQSTLDLNSSPVVSNSTVPQDKIREGKGTNNTTLANKNAHSMQGNASNTSVQSFAEQDKERTADVKQNFTSKRSTAPTAPNLNSKADHATTNSKNEIANTESDVDLSPSYKESIISKNEVNEAVDKQSVEEIDAALPLKGIDLFAQNLPRDLVKVKHKSKIPLSLYARVGGGLMENYKTASPYESGLINLSLNIEARFNSILLRAGVGTQYTTHADLVVSQRAKVYGFGVRNQQNDLAYQDLLDIYVPLELGYQIKSTSFGIGVQANYLLTTSMNFNTYQDQVLTNSRKYYGNKNGLRSFSSQGYVWLEQRVLPRFSVGLKIGTNISGRIKDEKYFNRSATINPIYGQLIFRINIL